MRRQAASRRSECQAASQDAMRVQSSVNSPDSQCCIVSVTISAHHALLSGYPVSRHHHGHRRHGASRHRLQHRQLGPHRGQALQHQGTHQRASLNNLLTGVGTGIFNNFNIFIRWATCMPNFSIFTNQSLSFHKQLRHSIASLD